MDKKRIYQSFLEGSLEVKSVSLDRKVEWKRITNVTRHDVSDKEQYRVITDIGVSCSATGDHSLFTSDGPLIREYKTGKFAKGDTIICVENDKVIDQKIGGTLLLPPVQYMYDLSVEDNENFVLKSGILAHNTFRPPSSEKFLQSQAQVFGYVWENEELYEFVLMAVDMFNSAPPVTGIDINTIPDRWRTTVLMRAAGMACGALAVNWIADEFSVTGDELVTVRDLNDQEYVLSFEDLFDIIYGDMMEEIQKRVREEFLEDMEKIENENI